VHFISPPRHLIRGLVVLLTMSDKLIEETEVLPKKDRVKETINASLEDVRNLYVVSILDKITWHFEKKLFGKEKEFQKEASDVRQKHLEAVKCEYSWDTNSVTNPMVYTIDDIPVGLKKVLKSRGDGQIDSENELMQKLCYKYDKNREFVIIPVFEKIVKDYWLYS